MILLSNDVDGRCNDADTDAKIFVSAHLFHIVYPGIAATV